MPEHTKISWSYYKVKEAAMDSTQKSQRQVLILALNLKDE